VFELKEEIFYKEGKHNFSKCLGHEMCCAKLAYSTQIFNHPNSVNTGRQGRNRNIPYFYGKPISFLGKKIWKRRTKKSLEMLALVAKTHIKIFPVVTEYLTTLEENIKKNFHPWLRTSRTGQKRYNYAYSFRCAFYITIGRIIRSHFYSSQS
jgi:hypothetical protein